MPSEAHNATISGREDLTGSLAIFRVRPDGEPRSFVPGQYFTLGLPAGDRFVRRPYSVASGSNDLGEYEFYIRLIPGGALTPLLFASRPGDRIWIGGPKGRFVLAPGDDRLHLLVATGCGIAPFVSMIRSGHGRARPLRAVLLHGVSYERELAYRSLLEPRCADPRYAFAYVPTLSRPAAPENAGWRGCTGRVEGIVARTCETFGVAPSDAVGYICGNPEMTHTVQTLLRARGFAASQVRTEEYWPLRRAEP